ncbi:MAG: MFS transporter [bacterium]
MFINDIKELSPDTSKLLATRMIRSIGQGILIVDFTLYLHAMHWKGSSIGIVLSSAGLFGAILSLFVGITSDRFRRKPFLITYQILLIIGCIVSSLTANPWLIGISATLGGFGRGANGAAGPFSPAEQAWLAEKIRPTKRGMVYSINTAFGFFGTGIGAMLAILPTLWSKWFPGATSYRPLFTIVGLLAIITLILILFTNEEYPGSKNIHSIKEYKEVHKTQQKENHALIKLVVANMFNGIAIGMTGPLIAYWFAIKFHVGPDFIAPVMAITLFVTGVVTLFTGRMTERIGIVRSVVFQRSFGLLMLLLLPVVPFYWLASLVYLLRSAFNRSTTGARQALAIGLVRGERRGLAASLNAVSMQLPNAIGPTITGYFFQIGRLVLPFYIAALFQAAYIVIYRKFFSGYELSQEE